MAFKIEKKFMSHYQGVGCNLKLLVPRLFYHYLSASTNTMNKGSFFHDKQIPQSHAITRKNIKVGMNSYKSNILDLYKFHFIIKRYTVDTPELYHQMKLSQYSNMKKLSFIEYTSIIIILDNCALTVDGWMLKNNYT